MSHSQALLAAIGDEPRDCGADPQAGLQAWAALFIVVSPRPGTGKTLLARLVADFLRIDGGAVEAFELSPGDIALSDRLPTLTASADLDSTQAQIRLFDRLILADGVARVVDLGHAAFLRFFVTIDEIGFIAEAERRRLDIVVLFAADPHIQSVNAYAVLQRRFPTVALVPVFNEGILKGRKLRDQYPFTRAASVPLQIPLLPPALRAHVERSGHSFVDFHSQLPPSVPIGPAFELRSWTRRTFLEFRELELRLLLEKLRASLRG